MRLRALRRLVTASIEAARRDGVVGSSLQAEVVLPLPDAEADEFAAIDWEELAIVSRARVTVEPGSRTAFTQAGGEAGPATQGAAPVSPATVSAAPGRKCMRCWRVLEEVGQAHAHPTLCLRCADVVERVAS